MNKSTNFDFSIYLSIVIVTYNHESEIGECLDAILNSSGDGQIEIIVIDNASRDNTRVIIQERINSNTDGRFTFLPIFREDNTGFTFGTNLGLKNAKGEFIMLLNPDTIVDPDAFKLLMNYLKENYKTGIVAPQLLASDGTIQASCRNFPQRRDIIWHLAGLNLIFPTSKIFNHWKNADFSHQVEAKVGQPQGAALMTHRRALKDVGLLDETFSMFFSDVDWCKRFIEKSWNIVFFPVAKVTHHQGTSIHRNRIPMIWSSHLSFIQYFQKYKAGFFNSILNVFFAIILIFMAFIRVLVIRISGGLFVKKT